jgi:conjugative transposon TraM protein
MNPSQEQLDRKRRSLLILPIPVVLFVSMLFWSLGGGTGNTAVAAPSPSQGLNAIVPGAQFSSDDTWDKFKLYEIASYDSAKFEEARESDPYFDLVAFKTDHNDSVPGKDSKLKSDFKRKDRLAADPNEERVNKKIEELYKEINRATPKPSIASVSMEDTTHHEEQFSSDVDRLEAMMQNMQTERKANPEMQQISEVLEKILDVQHPERVKEKLKTAVKDESLSEVRLTKSPVVTNEQFVPIVENSTSNIVTNATIATNGFFGLEDGLTSQVPTETIIEAVIHGEQQVVSGAVVKMRLLNDVTINGQTLPTDSFIYGTCNITGERLTIDINSIHASGTLLKVSLKVYDLDGIEGIYVPGAITRDVAKQSSDSALQGIQFMSMNPSIGAQAAAAGVEAAKGLFGKKAKLIQVTIKAGYQILLKNASSSAI